MALLTVQDIKDYLKIEHTAEDTMLAGWRLQAIAGIEAELGRPIALEERTFVLDTQRAENKLFAPVYPFAPEDSSSVTAPVLTDGDGTELVEDTDYRVDARSGILTRLTSGNLGGCFATYPYTLEVWVGLQALDEYATRVEPALNAAILDWVADRYQRRNPAATTEATGGDVSSGFSASAPGIPQRIKDALAPWRIEPLAT